jgi:hypothetical protein
MEQLVVSKESRFTTFQLYMKKAVRAFSYVGMWKIIILLTFESKIINDTKTEIIEN